MAAENIAVLTLNGSQLQRLRAAMRDIFEIVLGERDEEQLFQRRTLLTETPRSTPTSNTGLILQKTAISELLGTATAVVHPFTFPPPFESEEAKITHKKY